MEPLLIVLLIANAVFNAVVWPRFYVRVVKDPRARTSAGKPAPFLIVHTVIFAIALVLALASLLAAIAALTTG